MHRINSDGSTVDGRFKETPGPATQLTALWLNMIQDELVTVVTDPDGGDAALNFGDNGQLLQALLAIVARAVDNLVTVSEGADGHLQIGPVILKWGGFRETITDEVSRSIAFPTEFPTVCWRVIAVPMVASAGDEQDLWVQVIAPSVSTTGFSVQFQDDDSTDSRSVGFDYIAIGK